ncbi:hypothetical protein EJ05DRAFT_497816 [Pseudovirgaria hyperparasitica]|uniref:Uncharacterized protein n=1 Tax=Pseudovirgaria hyperparasitica TaxID=470096 RepID=A0A6A6WH07_9PEZI|nr:uncharacterized protein EJ05DRAFT_497816 [Pseudovirgaria hyperparasitica]KAF2761266.1 hypothetical protein EJ05DRAFT_497816 [Pseudovirgaria hyperparasitica]
MCRRVVHRYAHCGHTVTSPLLHCGNPQCEQRHEDQLGEPGYACSKCERSSVGNNSTSVSTSSRYSHTRRMSLDPAVRADLRSNLALLGSTHSNISTDTPTSAHSAHFAQHGSSNQLLINPMPTVRHTHQQDTPLHLRRSSQIQGGVQINAHVRMNSAIFDGGDHARNAPVSFPPPAPNVRRQEEIRTPVITSAVPADQGPPSAPTTPRRRRDSIRQAQWIGSPSTETPPPMPAVNVPFTHPGSPHHRRQGPSVSGVQQHQSLARRPSNSGDRPQTTSTNRRNSVNNPFGTQRHRVNQAQPGNSQRQHLGHRQQANPSQRGSQAQRALQHGPQRQHLGQRQQNISSHEGPQAQRANQHGPQRQQTYPSQAGPQAQQGIQDRSQHPQRSGISVDNNSSVDLGWPENPQFGHERSFYHGSNIW